MSHPSWTISWDVLSTSISRSTRETVVGVARSLSRSLVKRSTISVARGHPGKRARGTTDDGDDDALVVHLSIFGPDGATRRNDDPSRTHTVDDRSPLPPSALATLSRARARIRSTDTRRNGADRDGTLGCGSRHKGARERRRVFPVPLCPVHRVYHYHHPSRPRVPRLARMT